MRQEWKDFTPGVWQNEINVRDFIQKNYTPYAVSYTHLDVYKRQRTMRPALLGPMPGTRSSMACSARFTSTGN